MSKTHINYDGETLCCSKSVSAVVNCQSCTKCSFRLDDLIEASVLAVEKGDVSKLKKVLEKLKISVNAD